MTEENGAAAEAAPAPTYSMTVDLSVLEALGINLYSNAAAVLSELVANAYDADATLVKIDWKNHGERVIVADDGVGMTVAELNERFLRVGYKKRSEQGGKSKKWKRPFMGRKGIGKLSVFSIAETVSVFTTTKGKVSSGLKIKVADLEKAIDKGKLYHPDPVEVPADYRKKQGTVIVLDDLKKKRATLTANALRKRLARRFDVMETTPRNKGGFYIEVNGTKITYADRQELKKLEFIWEFGSKTLPDHALPDNITRHVISPNSVGGRTTWKVRGWIGTARKPTDLTDDEESGSLKNVIVLARKRPIQEGIIDKLDFSKLFGNYVTGQIEADFLDLDGKYEDIATSDRQRLMEDDERVVELQKFLRDSFGKAGEQWSAERPKKEAKNALDDFPKLKEWVDRRPDWQKEPAEKMIGTIASLELEDQAKESRVDLFKSGILAFERVGLRKTAKELESLGDVTAEKLLPLLGRQDTYEAGLWVDILRSRVEAIEQFQNLTDQNEKEKVLQKHLFEHLWLLDAGWERAVVGGKMEEYLKKIEPGFLPKDADGKEIKGRIDIRYAKTSGEHVIVELKRYKRKVDVDELYPQGLKYLTALRSVLDKQNRSGEHVNVVFVLGDHPTAKNAAPDQEPRDYAEARFAGINGRYMLYDQLIDGANNQYADYLDASAKAGALDELIDDLDAA